MGITGIGHVALKVADIDATLAFYTGVFGFAEMLRLTHDDGRLHLIYLRVTDDQYLELFPEAEGEAPGPSARAVHHFCLAVDDLDATVARLRAQGGVIRAWQDGELRPVQTDGIKLGKDGNRQAWLLDPDGHRIELMEMAPDGLQAQAIARLTGRI